LLTICYWLSIIYKINILVDRAVVKKRKAFEYKLRRKVKEKADFLNYIQVGFMNAFCTI